MAFWPWADFVAIDTSLLQEAKNLRFQADLREGLEGTVGEKPRLRAGSSPSTTQLAPLQQSLRLLPQSSDRLEACRLPGTRHTLGGHSQTHYKRHREPEARLLNLAIEASDSECFCVEILTVWFNHIF